MRLAFTDRWPLRATMIFERTYHRNLRMSFEDKRKLLSTRNSIVVWMYEPESRRLIGETYGVPIDAALGDVDEATSDLQRFAKTRTLYVYSTTILPRYQGMGFGKILKAYLLGRAFQAGYRVLIGHARQGPSVALNVHFGAELRGRHANWYKTGEAYWFYVLKLS
jgi:GNAT superfamily N-acetyltransferase